MSALDELKEAAISQQDLEARGFKLIQLHESDSLVDQPIQEAEIREVEDEQQLIIETETESMDPSTKDSSELSQRVLSHLTAPGATWMQQIMRMGPRWPTSLPAKLIEWRPF